MGNNFRLYLEDGTEIGYFYPNDKFVPEEHGWIDMDENPPKEIVSCPFKPLRSK